MRVFLDGTEITGKENENVLMTIFPLLKDNHLMSIFPNLIFQCINICDKNVNRAKKMPIPITILTHIQRNGQYLTISKAFFRVSPTGPLSISQNVASPLN